MGHIIVDGWRPKRPIFHLIHNPQPPFYSKCSCLGLKKRQESLFAWKDFVALCAANHLSWENLDQKNNHWSMHGQQWSPPPLAQLHWLKPRWEIYSVTRLKNCLECDFHAATSLRRWWRGKEAVLGFDDSKRERLKLANDLGIACFLPYSCCKKPKTR